MTLGRKRKYANGATSRSFYLPVEVAIRLDLLPNASEFVARVLMVALEGTETELIDQRKEETRAKIQGLKEVLAEAEKKLIALDEQEKAFTKVRVDSTAARLKFLEVQSKVGRTPSQLLSWLENRSDVLAECDFKSPDEAVVWYTENAGKAAR